MSPELREPPNRGKPWSERKTASLILALFGILFTLGSPCTCGFSAWPGLLLSIAGVVCRRRAVLPWVGVFLGILGAGFSLLWTPLGDCYPLNRARFALMMGPCRFWTHYDKGALKTIRNRELLFSSTALLVFQAESDGTYTVPDVKRFAAENDLRFESERSLAPEILVRLAAAERACPSGEDYRTWCLVQHMASRFPLSFKRKCTLLVFYGPDVSSALVLVPDDGRTMAVYCGHGCRD